jgi:two-component system, OmpR family, sensor kinase
MRHTPAGTPVEVAVWARDADAILAVRDEGPGIPPGDRPHVFERFYRAAGGKAYGSGLGLAIASELAARMSGTLRLSSTTGQTVFALELPAGPADAVARRAQAGEHVPESTPEPAAPAR